MPIILEGELGCLPHLYKRVKEKGYAVVVVAEGAGEDILGTSVEVSNFRQYFLYVLLGGLNSFCISKE